VTTNLSSRVRQFYPAWNDADNNNTQYFDVSVSLQLSSPRPFTSQSLSLSVSD